ncbi:MAG: hypothetical protein AAGF11_18335 [Myxococcota bacterium]
MSTSKQTPSRATGVAALCWLVGCVGSCADDAPSRDPDGTPPSFTGTGDAHVQTGKTTAVDDTAASTAGDDACNDSIWNGDETDVDCGGPCSPCPDGQMCREDRDCISTTCERGTCEQPACRVDGMRSEDETDVDCGGGSCPPCNDGRACLEDSDCASRTCRSGLCIAPSCNNGIQDGTETDVDCGNTCGPTCRPGEGCVRGSDCITRGCDEATNTCNDPLTVSAWPVCSTFSGTPVSLAAAATGGSGTAWYTWAPDDGTLSDPNLATPEVSPEGFEAYTVTAEDGFSTAEDRVIVLDSNPFDLMNNCTLYTADYGIGAGAPASITYDMDGTRACELGNGEFGLHLCEGFLFESVRLQAQISVSDPTGDDDWVGLVWGAQDASHFYSMAWKGGEQNNFGCFVPSGIIVRIVNAASFESLTFDDFFCEYDTPRSTLILGPSQTTIAGWEEGESYTVTIDRSVGANFDDVTIERNSDQVEIAWFTVAGTSYDSGFFGSFTASQQGACVGPLLVECL